MFESNSIYQPHQTQMHITNDMSICQADYPLDWYQDEFIPYAEEYQALPDRKLTTILAWMTPYVQKAQAHFGDQLLLLVTLLYGR